MFSTTLTRVFGSRNQRLLKRWDKTVAEINANSGIKGNKLEVIYEDGKGTAKDSVAAVRKLIDIHKVPVILGPAASTNFLAVAPICESAHVVLIGAESAAPAISKAGEYIFRVFPSDKLQGKGVAQLVNKLGYKEVPVLYINNDPSHEKRGARRCRLPFCLRRRI